MTIGALSQVTATRTHRLGAASRSAIDGTGDLIAGISLHTTEIVQAPNSQPFRFMCSPYSTIMTPDKAESIVFDSGQEASLRKPLQDCHCAAPIRHSGV
jgi:hypothetical protein